MLNPLRHRRILGAPEQTIVLLSAAVQECHKDFHHWTGEIPKADGPTLAQNAPLSVIKPHARTLNVSVVYPPVPCSATIAIPVQG